jgi:hypothetical protein
LQDVGDASGEIDGRVVRNTINSEIKSAARGRDHIGMKLSLAMGGKCETKRYDNQRRVF